MSEEAKVYVVIENAARMPVIKTGIIEKHLPNQMCLVALDDGEHGAYPEKVVFYALNMAEFIQQELLRKAQAVLV